MKPHDNVLADIRSERVRQIEVEGWSYENDDRLVSGELAVGASIYANHAGSPDHERKAQQYIGVPPSRWPFCNSWWKPRSRREDLIRAAALIVAEIERLDRLGYGASEVVANSNAEPFYSRQRAHFSTEDQLYDWINKTIDEAKAAGAKWVRSSCASVNQSQHEPQDYGIYLVEGWKVKPTVLPPPRFHLTE